MDRTRGFSGALALMGGLLLVLPGCSTFRVTTDYDPEANFQELKSYAWLAKIRKPSDDPRLHNSLVDGRVRAAVDRELAAKGYSKAGTSSADFLVTYYLGLEKKINIHTIHSSYGYGYRGWYGGYGGATLVDQYEEGSLLLDILDSEGGDLLWRGTARARVRSSNSPEERQRRINNAVAEILSRFPPQ